MTFGHHFCTIPYTFYVEIFRDALEYHAYKKNTIPPVSCLWNRQPLMFLNDQIDPRLELLLSTSHVFE